MMEFKLRDAMEEALEAFQNCSPLWRVAVIVGTVSSVLVVPLTIWRLRRAASARKMHAKRQRKRDACRRSIEALATRLRDVKVTSVEEIVSLSPNELALRIREEKLKAVDVLHAFQAKALEAHEKTNCLVEIIAEADDWAAERDAGEPKGILYGVPVSLKEYFSVKGYDSSLGILGWLEKPATEDSVLVKVLKSQGAVPFVKTNLPHMGFSFTSKNPVFGNTLNPDDPSRGPGGSSGGESALIRLHGSPLGWGSDVGGSIRNPAHFCGLAGLKPTGNRLSSHGIFTVEGITTTMPIVIGPMANDVESLVLAMKALLVPEMFALDRSVPPIPFKTEVYEGNNKLRVGFYLFDGLFHAVSSCQRAVFVARDILSGMGHEVIPWELPPEIAKAAEALAIKGKIFFADQGQSMMEIMEGDEANVNIADFMMIASLPIWVRKIMSKLLIFVDKEAAAAVKYSCGVGSVANWWKTVTEVQRLRESFEAAWDSLDVLISPAFCSPAMPEQVVLGPIGNEGSYNQVYNVLDLPAGVVPVTTVTPDDMLKMQSYPTTTHLHRLIKKGMEGAEGLPIGVQVVAPRWQEELCLRVMKQIEDGVTKSS